VREQYRLQLYKYHPDHNPGNEEWAVTQTIALVEACRVLSDPKARKEYDFAIAWKPREQGATGGIALFKGKAGKEAEAKFDEGLRHWKADRPVPATEAFKHALRLSPGFSDAAYNLALLLVLHHHHHAALEILGKAVKEDPKDEGLAKLRSAVSRTFFSV